ncbi:MAG: glutamine synthetase, partial [Candidatus Thermoplasmatota archaeon]|nr:glutamine synthetase [Candidatus Thermoplasmatota archaeon]
VKRTLDADREIRFIRFMTADMNGERPCGFTIPVSELGGRQEMDGTFSFSGVEPSLEVYKGFDASSLYPERINESDKNAWLDFSTARVLPWQYHTQVMGFERKWREMVVFGDIIDPKNGPYKFDSRNILKRVLAKVKDMGIADTIYLGPEMEFFLLEADDTGDPVLEEFSHDDCVYLRPVPLDKGRYFKGGKYGVVRKEAQIVLQEMGYRFEYDHHEVSDSQHECDVHYMEALEMADFVILFRYVIKKVAASYGLFASFMPKPIAGVNGNGMHTHQSLFKDGSNIFYDPDDEHHLSMQCKRYISGLMKYVPEICAGLNPWVNSFKRLVPGYEAPAYICCDVQNRSSLIRIPGYEMNNPNAIRIELRNPDPSSNPYLSFALQIWAGVRGITEGLDPPSIRDINVFELSEEEMDGMGIQRLPPDLSSALDLMETSTLAKEVMGGDLLSHYLTAKRAHLDGYRTSLGHRKNDISMRVQISKFEMEQLLPIL